MFIQYYSYDVNLENQDQLFVITGLNGSGKTTIMRILDNLSQGKLHYFYELPFNSIEIKLKNDQDPSEQSTKLLIQKRVVFDYNTRVRNSILQLFITIFMTIRVQALMALAAPKVEGESD